jgi:hypothetical protein
MNSSYFKDRQDRYLHFSRQPRLTEYAIEYASTLSKYTYRLMPAPGPSSSAPTYHLVWRNQDAEPGSFESLALQAVQDLQNRWRSQLATSETTGDTSIFPLIQSGVLGIREEETSVGTLLDNVAGLGSPATVDLTSGYFGLYAPYKHAILCSPNTLNWRIVAASPKVLTVYSALLDTEPFSLGKWILRFEGTLRAFAGGVHLARTNVLACRQESWKNRNQSTYCTTQRMATGRLDVSCQRLARSLRVWACSETDDRDLGPVLRKRESR